MTQLNATVRTEDLGATLTYLEGLVLLMRRLQHAEGIGRVLADELARSLQAMDADDPICFDPLRYESGASGMGWEAVTLNVSDLRNRLLEGYAEAAL